MKWRATAVAPPVHGAATGLAAVVAAALVRAIALVPATGDPVWTCPSDSRLSETCVPRPLGPGRGQRPQLTLFVIIVAIAPVLMGTGVAGVQEPITVQDLAEQGVSLTSPSAPTFDARMTQLVPEWSTLASALKPYLVILSNQSARTIVAYCVQFEVTNGDGRVFQDVVHFNYPAAVARTAQNMTGLPRGREVRPGEARVVGTSFEIMPAVDNRWLDAYAKQQRERFGTARKLSIWIDAVIFEDGTLLGNDVSDLRHAFDTYLNASQQIYRGIVSRIQQGSSVDEAFSWLSTTATEAKSKVANNRDALYYVQAAGDVIRARRSLGDTQVSEVLARSIRDVPFVITPPK